MSPAQPNVLPPNDNPLWKEADPIADELIRRLYDDKGPEQASELIRRLVERGFKPAPYDELPLYVQDFINQGNMVVQNLDPTRFQRAEKIFWENMPHILTTLVLYSLPSVYALDPISRALAKTGLLVDETLPRIFYTLQMVVDVMGPQGMAPDGQGIRTCRAVRLRHADSRRRVKSLPVFQGNNNPIDQLELVWTLAAFTTAVLDGLQRFGDGLSPEEEDDYLYTWLAVGRLIGIPEELLPRDMKTMREWTQTTGDLQVSISPQALVLKDSLINAMQGLLVFPILSPLPISIMHFLMDPVIYKGESLTKLLEIPPEDFFWEFLMRILREILKIDEGALSEPGLVHLKQAHQLQSLGLMEKLFDGLSIPEPLHQEWRQRTAGAYAQLGRLSQPGTPAVP
jgi:hypothetical protein